MKKLYQKNEICFAIGWIVVYVLSGCVKDQADPMDMSLRLPVLAGLITVLLLFIWKNGSAEKYGLCALTVPPRKLLWFAPMAILCSANLWLGVQSVCAPLKTVVYILTMLLVGLMEELLFRGLLFRAMERTNHLPAVIVSSVTFGAGHIVNLFNGSGTDPVAGICQVFYATALGFMLLMVFLRGGSLIPCILFHGLFNTLSIFSRQSAWTNEKQIMVGSILFVLAIGYGLWLSRQEKKPCAACTDKSENE